MKCKITRQKSGVEYYQYECKTHDACWLGGLDSKKPAACHRAAEHSVHLDVCPRCAGSGKVLDGLVTGKCLQCNGTGKRH